MTVEAHLIAKTNACKPTFARSPCHKRHFEFGKGHRTWGTNRMTADIFQLPREVDKFTRDSLAHERQLIERVSESLASPYESQKLMFRATFSTALKRNEREKERCL